MPQVFYYNFLRSFSELSHVNITEIWIFVLTKPFTKPWIINWCPKLPFFEVLVQYPMKISYGSLFNDGWRRWSKFRFFFFSFLVVCLYLLRNFQNTCNATSPPVLHSRQQGCVTSILKIMRKFPPVSILARLLCCGCSK